MSRKKMKNYWIFTNEGLIKEKTNQAFAWDIITIAGIADIFVWETISSISGIQQMPPIIIDKPTLK